MTVRTGVNYDKCKECDQKISFDPNDFKRLLCLHVIHDKCIEKAKYDPLTITMKNCADCFRLQDVKVCKEGINSSDTSDSSTTREIVKDAAAFGGKLIGGGVSGVGGGLLGFLGTVGSLTLMGLAPVGTVAVVGGSLILGASLVGGVGGAYVGGKLGSEAAKNIAGKALDYVGLSSIKPGNHAPVNNDGYNNPHNIQYVTDDFPNIGVGKFLGAGGIGAVFEAKDSNNNGIVIKQILLKSSDNAKDKDKVKELYKASLDETRRQLLEGKNNQNQGYFGGVVPILSVGEVREITDGSYQLLFTMPKLQSFHTIQSSGCYTAAHRIKYAYDLVRSMRKLLDVRMVHTDLKTGNVMYRAFPNDVSKSEAVMIDPDAIVSFDVRDYEYTPDMQLSRKNEQGEAMSKYQAIQVAVRALYATVQDDYLKFTYGKNSGSLKDNAEKIKNILDLLSCILPKH